MRLENTAAQPFFDEQGNILIAGKIARLENLKTKGAAAFAELASSGLSSLAGSAGQADSAATSAGLPETATSGASVYFLGVSANRFEDEYFTPLKYCDRDVEALRVRFSRLAAETEQRFFPLVAGQEKADRQLIDGYFEELAKVVSEEDTVVITVASHGLNLDRGLYLALPTTVANSLQATGLDWTTIIDQVGRMKARRVIVLLDACHAGSFAKSSQEFVQRTSELMKERSGLTVIAACDASESSLELGEDSQHGAFTQGILESLQSLDAFEDDFDTWFAELKTRVSKLTKGKQNPVVIQHTPVVAKGRK